MMQSLDLEVRALLEQRRGEWPTIALECEVSYSWISKFVRAEISNPGFRTLQRLQQRLNPQPSASTAAAAQTTSFEPASSPAAAFMLGGRREDDHTEPPPLVNGNGQKADEQIEAIGALTGDVPRRSSDGQA